MIDILATAAGKVFVGSLPMTETRRLLQQEAKAHGIDAQAFRSEAQQELAASGYASMERADGTGYVSIAAPIRDWTGEVRFALSLVGSRATLDVRPKGPHVKALLESCTRATLAMGGSIAT